MLVSYSKVGHVGNEDIDLDNLLNGGTGLLEDSLEVGNASGSLLLDRALDKVALGVTGDLAGAVDGRGGFDGLGLFNLFRRMVSRVLEVKLGIHKGRQLQRE